jgi:hypothetical protein
MSSRTVFAALAANGAFWTWMLLPFNQRQKMTHKITDHTAAALICSVDDDTNQRDGRGVCDNR